MTPLPLDLDWNDLAFGSKKPVNRLHAVFIAAPRQLSAKRFTQLVKTYLPQGNIVLGLAKEHYVLGFESQPQFQMLQVAAVQRIIDKVSASGSPHRIYTLRYFQRDLPYILQKLDFRRVLCVNGSWKHMFHTLPSYYILASRGTPYELVSPFCDEQEARHYEASISPSPLPNTGSFSQLAMMALADQAATHSYDYGFQTGAVLGRKQKGNYRLLASAFNRVVPYQTFAMHHGASRETHFSPMNDLNHYDTIHAEVGLIVVAQKQGIDLSGTTLFINLLPCPGCARMFTRTDIAEFVYRLDHSDGYCVRMLEMAGKKVTRLVS